MTSTNEDPKLLNTDRRGRVRTPRAQQQALLDEFEQSDVPGTKLAALVGIKYPRFASWVLRRRKVGRTDPAPPAGDSAATVRWLEAMADKSLTSSAANSSALLVEPWGGARFAITSPAQDAVAAAFFFSGRGKRPRRQIKLCGHLEDVRGAGTVRHAQGVQWPAHAGHGEVGRGSARGRALRLQQPAAFAAQDSGEVMLVGCLREVIRRLNPGIPEEAREKGLRKVHRVGSPSLTHTNRAGGVRLQEKNKNGLLTRPSLLKRGRYFTTYGASLVCRSGGSISRSMPAAAKSPSVVSE